MTERPPHAPLMLELLKPPVFADEEQTRQSRVLHTVMLVTIAVVTATATLELVALPHSAGRWVALALSVDAVALCLLGANRRGHTRLAGIVTIAAFGVIATVFASTSGGISAPGVTAYIVIVMFAGLLLGAQASVPTAVVLAFVGVGLVYLEAAGLLPARTVFHTPLTLWLVLVMYMGLAVAIQWLATRSIKSALDRVRSELSARSQAEQSLRESESRFRALAESSFEGIALTKDGAIIDVNDQLAAMLGARRSEVIGRRVIDFVAPESRDEVRRALGAQNPLPYEHLVLRTDGTVFPVEIRARYMTIGDRTMRVTVIRDLTFRKQAEEAIQESAERLRRLGDNLPNGMVYQVVREHDGAMRFVYVSAGVERFNGVKPEAVLKDASVLYGQIIDEDRALLATREEESFRNMSELNVEVRMHVASGEPRWMQLCSAPRRLPDGRVLWDGIQLDITERKKAEEERASLEAQLRESQKMQALGVLAGGVAHDFNNILVAIKGNTKLAIEELAANHPLQQSLAEIAKATERAVSLVRRILTFSRRQEPVRKALQLAPVVEEALGLVRATLPPMIEIRTDFAAALPSVSADAAQIHQVVMNLGANAAQAIGDCAGTIDTRLAAITVDAALARTSADLRQGRYVRLSVRDTGHGMDRATLERVFEPFFTTKPAGQGTGLGLPVVHGIVKNHEGAITIESELGIGTTFHVYFPAVDQVSADATIASPTASRGHGESVLYVDDEEALVFLVKRVLERTGYRVTGFTDPAQAVDAFRAKPHEFDVVVTDLSMPGMPGTELARELLRIRPDLPIIMTSGYIRPTDSEVAKSLGVRDLILKPNTVDELGSALQRVFAGIRGSAEV